MKPLRIDFATNSFSRLISTTTPTTWMLAVIGIISLGLVSVAALKAEKKYEATTRALRQVQDTIDSRRKKSIVPSYGALPTRQVESVNQAIRQLNLPWREVWNVFEAVTPASIALLALEPDSKKQIAHVTAEAKTADEMVAYVERLKAEPFFDSVVVTRHEINEQDLNKPLRFQLDAHWVGNEP